MPLLIGTVDAGANADPDHDGITNAWEFALGLNPVVADMQTIPSITTFADQTGSYFRVTFPRQYERRVIYRFQTSNDLQGWSSAAGDVKTINSLLGTLTFQDRTGIGTSPRRFARIKLSVD